MLNFLRMKLAANLWFLSYYNIFYCEWLCRMWFLTEAADIVTTSGSICYCYD